MKTFRLAAMTLLVALVGALSRRVPRGRTPTSRRRTRPTTPRRRPATPTRRTTAQPSSATSRARAPTSTPRTSTATRPTNVQEGDNDVEADQTRGPESGAAVGGQVIGGVVERRSRRSNATNSSEDVDVTTGDADSTNDFAAFVGLITGDDATSRRDIISGAASNVQEGDNSADVTQESTATTGDGVAGQILGATHVRQRRRVTLANTVEDTERRHRRLDAGLRRRSSPASCGRRHRV